MSVVMIMEWDGVTKEQYEAARSLVNWEGNVPVGARFHVSAFGDTGLRVVDVWDSAEDFQRFVDTRLAQGVKQVGIETQPRVEIFPVHALFTPGFLPKA
ncbi:MAG TPA: hypothetical protein VFC51_07390 [Chloroflexota bacterium]|nr:hypothetical protein [Chloroflexota bacterium]